MKKSVKLFIFGFLLGIVLSFIFPSLYNLIFGALQERMEAQSKIVSNPFIGILLNNITASFITAYGGVFLTRLFLFLKSDEKSLKYSLFLFPYSVLLLNGFILGVFFNALGIEKFIRGLLPHGVLEIPAILLSGSIGIEIGEKSLKYIENREKLREKIIFNAKKSIKNYFIVILLLLIAGFLEVSTI